MIIVFPAMQHYININTSGNQWQFTLIMVPNMTVLVNIICLYFQYPFGQKSYDKYCGLMHKCWRVILTHQATSSLMRRYNNSKQENSKVAAECVELQVDDNLDLQN